MWYDNISVAAQSDAAAITAGTTSNLNTAADAGRMIVDAVVNGIVSELGSGGTATAINQVASQFTRNVTSAISTGLDAVTDLASTSARAIGLGAGFITTAITTTLGAVVGLAAGNIPGLALGGVVGGGMGAVIGGGISLLGDAFGGLFGIISQGIESAAQTAGTAISALSNVVQDLESAARNVTQTVSSLRLATGMSSGGAFGLSQLSILGINPMALAGRDASISNLMGGMFGVSPIGSSDFMQSLARQFQNLQEQGFVGRSLAGTLANTYGMNNPQGLATLNLSPEQIGGQQRFASSFNQSIGLADPVKSAQEMMLAQQRATYSFDMIKIKLMELSSPVIVSALGGLANVLREHGSDIVEAIRGGIIWLYADLPPLLVSAGHIILDAGEAITRGLMDMGHTFADFIRSLDTGSGSFADAIGNVLAGFDGLINGTKSFLQSIALVGQGIYNLSSFLSDLVASMVNNTIKPFQMMASAVGAPILERLGLKDLADFARGVGGFQVPTLDQVTGHSRFQYDDILKRFASVPDSNLAGAWENMRGSRDWGETADKMDKQIDSTGGEMLGRIDAARKWLDSRDLGTPDERRSIIEQLMQINNNTGRIANTNDAMAQANAAAAKLPVSSLLYGIAEQIGMVGVQNMFNNQ